MKILVLGEVNVDLVLRNYNSFPVLGREVLVQDASLAVGGSSALCALALAKLGSEVTFIGKVGSDPWGDLCVESLQTAGVDCSLVIKDTLLKTGVTVSITSAKDRAFVTYLGATGHLEAAGFNDKHFVGYRHLHISSFFLQGALRPGIRQLFARAHAHGLTTSLDPGFDPTETWQPDLIETLSEVDVFLPNEVELEHISAETDRWRAIETLHNGRTLTVAKLGSEGCIAMKRGSRVSVPAFSVTPLDTTGAGDSFNAGFLHSWLRGEPLADAMRFAAACGALSTLAVGGTAGQPTLKDVDEFMIRNTETEPEK